MAIEYEFTRVNPLCLCDENDDLTTQKVEVSMKAFETGFWWNMFLRHTANGEVILLSGDDCVAPDALNLGTLLNDLATEQNWKTDLAAAISAQQAEAHEWTGHLTPPAVS